MTRIQLQDISLVPTQLPTANPAAIFKALAEGAVIFLSDSELYFGLNEVGARLWQLLPPATATVDEMVAQLASEYPDAPADVIRQDVEEMLAELESCGLVLPRTAELPLSEGQAVS
jgi:hypothetical protein